MNVSLTPELENLVQSHVQSGRYSSAEHVLAEALRLLDERNELTALFKEDLDKKIAAGMASLQRGEGVDGEEFFDKLEARLLAKERTQNK